MSCPTTTEVTHEVTPFTEMAVKATAATLASVDALDTAAKLVTAAKKTWKNQIEPSIEKNRAESTAPVPPKKISDEDALIPFGAALHFVHATPAFVDRATAAHSTASTLAAARRLRVCEEVAAWVAREIATRPDETQIQRLISVAESSIIPR